MNYGSKFKISYLGGFSSSTYRILFSVILLGVVLYVVSRAIDIGDLRTIILNVPKPQLAEFVGLGIIISTLKAWRFLILLRNNDIEVSFWENFKAFTASQAISPLPGGEAMRGILIKHETGVSFLKTTGPVITQAFLELLTASVLAVLGSLIFKFLRVPSIIALILMLLITLLLIKRSLLERLKNNFKKGSFFEKLLSGFSIAQKNVHATIIDSESNLPDKVITIAFGISLLINLVGGFLILLIARSYGVDLDIFRSIYLYSAGTVIAGIATISPGGLGFTEGGLTGLLLLLNVGLSKALAIVLVFRLSTFVFSVLIGLLFLAIFYSKVLLFKSLAKSKI